MTVSTDDLREAYIDYFESHDHAHYSSSSLVPDDPTMLFTSAGMVQFKDIFWGHREAEEPRVVTCQKCFRANDIQRVGQTAYHHTFFEMLGNFSFGDYFKRGAIDLAWEFVTDVLSFSPDRLWVSVYEQDERAYRLWRDEIGVPAERIVRLGKDENWWGPVGDTGPCGPDSEIFYDAGETLSCGPDCDGVACDCNRFNELWNLVFTGYEMTADGEVRELSSQNIDTGMGLERTAAVLQDVESDFEIDIFAPIVDAVMDKVLPAESGFDRVQSEVHRIADHVRGAAFVISEGVLPSNDGRGYVLRRIIRRAVRAGKSLGKNDVFLPSLLPAVLETMGSTYPQLAEREKLIETILASEEEKFRETLAQGEQLVTSVVSDLKSEGSDTIPGKQAFDLYDTHGVPPDIIEDLARDHGLEVDMEGFEQEMTKQRQRARASASVASSDWVPRATPDINTEFVGYHRDRAEVELLACLSKGESVSSLGEGEQAVIILDRTPFYAEAGGQVSDTGYIRTDQGLARVSQVITDGESYLHRAQVESGTLNQGETARAVIDEDKRRATERNHTATHLLHRTLKEILGSHVVQSGSKVSPDGFRFDFNHFEPLDSETIADIEDYINDVIWDDRSVNIEWVNEVEEARRQGALAHFEEEYRGRDRLRIVTVEDFSKELCGGTHVDRTGQIGGLVILSTENIASGTRRIQAVTGSGLIEAYRSRDGQLGQLADLTGAGKGDVQTRVEAILEDRDELQQELEEKTDRLLSSLKDQYLAESQSIGSATLIVARPDLYADDLKQLADYLENEIGGVIVLGSGVDDTASVLCKVSSTFQQQVPANSVVSNMAEVVGGGGGGDSSFAQGGGPHSDRLNEALQVARDFIGSKLDSSQ